MLQVIDHAFRQKNYTPPERWEIQPVKDGDLSWLDEREMKVTLEQALYLKRMNEPRSRKPMDILRAMGLLREDDQLTHAAVVLFCREGVKLDDYPQLMLKVGRIWGERLNLPPRMREFHGNAFALLRRAQDFLIDSLPIAGRVLPGSFVREDIPLFPVAATYEALANAFVHRDYSIRTGGVGVMLFDDRLEIQSTGALRYGLSPEILSREHGPFACNPTIADVFYQRGIIQSFGSGLLKIAHLMRQQGLNLPVMTERDGSVVVTFDVWQAKALRGWPGYS